MRAKYASKRRILRSGLTERSNVNPRGGMSSSGAIEITELDDIILAYAMGPHPEWIDDYLAMMKRRRKENDQT